MLLLFSLPIASSFALSTSLKFAEMRQFLPLKPWNHMDVKVEYVLSCGFAVLLDDANSVGACGFFYCEGNLFGDFVDLA